MQRQPHGGVPPASGELPCNPKTLETTRDGGTISSIATVRYKKYTAGEEPGKDDKVRGR
jgi:hypothetical protein